MKALLKTAALFAGLLFSLGAGAQSSGGGFGLSKEIELFNFSLNSKSLEIGLNLGQVGSFTGRERFGIGASISYAGVYVDFLHADPQHRYFSYDVDTFWNDNEAFCINAGYWIPVFEWLRIVPLAGYAQTSEGVTDGSTSHYSGDESGSWVHDYTVTPGSREHYFNFGGGISIRPVKYFSINVMATRRAIYGGIVLNFLAFI